MQHRRSKALYSSVLVAGLVLAACGSDDNKADTTTTAAAATTAAPADTTAATTAATGGGAAAGSLKGVRPDTISRQTDWNREAEHGFLYQMIGRGYTVEKDKTAVIGPLVSKGVDTGVKFEV